MNEVRHDSCEDIRGLQSVPRGFLRLLILRLLRNRELTGTQIMEILEERSNGKWRPSPGSIYPLLSSLEKERVIEEVRIEGRSKSYTLSEKGDEHFIELGKHKGAVEDRTRLHRLVWMQMLDPVDQALFHTHGIRLAIEHLDDLQKQLTDNQKQKLKVKLTKAHQQLGELLTILGD
ncbi:MAG: PadR family transcriptional regulator [Candidatus Thorarchaeota archaeon]